MARRSWDSWTQEDLVKRHTALLTPDPPTAVSIGTLTRVHARTGVTFTEHIRAYWEPDGRQWRLDKGGQTVGRFPGTWGCRQAAWNLYGGQTGYHETPIIPAARGRE